VFYVKSTDGFYIAEKDLEIRGPGEILGTKQTGIADLKIADLIRDAALIPDIKNMAWTRLAGNIRATRKLLLIDG